MDSAPVSPADAYYEFSYRLVFSMQAWQLEENTKLQPLNKVLDLVKDSLKAVSDLVYEFLDLFIVWYSLKKVWYIFILETWQPWKTNSSYKLLHKHTQHLSVLPDVAIWRHRGDF